MSTKGEGNSDTTAPLVLKIILEINNAVKVKVKEVEVHREQCEYSTGHLGGSEMIRNNEKLTSQAIDATAVVHTPDGGAPSAVGVSSGMSTAVGLSADNPAATPANTTSRSSSCNGGFSLEEPLVSLTTLSSEEAVRLLVSLGCASDLRQRVDAMMEMIDGSFLMEIGDIDVFYELEQTLKTAIRTTHYRKVLKKLQALQQAGGVSPAVLQSLRDQAGPILSIVEADKGNESTVVPPAPKAMADKAATIVPPPPRPATPPAAAVQTLSVLMAVPSSTVRSGGGQSENRCNAASAVGDEVAAADATRCLTPTTVAPSAGAKRTTDEERNETIQRIDALEIREDAKTQLRRLMRNDPTLTTLDLSGHPFGRHINAAGVTVVASMLRVNTTLTTLNLNGNSIGAVGVTEVASALEANTTLTTLHLSNNFIGATGAPEATSLLLRGNTTLKTLDLSGNLIGAVGAKALASALRGNTTLTSLDLDGNGIGDEGAMEIASALRGNTTLTTLNLGGNRIGAVCASKVASALRANTALTKLDLYGKYIGTPFNAHLDVSKVNSYNVRGLRGGF
eukprot:gene16510-11807_t